ncbi:T9SS type A sorting domain-containing protein [bacterium]|nr:T9SS type A sorting domain-containing protein [bacterium]
MKKPIIAIILLIALFSCNHEVYPSTPAVLPPTEINIEILDIFAETFPDIIVRVSIRDELDSCICGLDLTDFNIFENTIEVTGIDSFNAYCNIEKFDIVIVLEDCGYMGSYIWDVYDNLGEFAAELDSSDVNYRLGLVTFKDDVDFDGTRFGLGFELTPDVEIIRDMVYYHIPASSCGDLPNSSLDAITDALDSLLLRPDAQIIIILITGSNPHYLGDGTTYSSVTLESTVAVLLEREAICYAICLEGCSFFYRGLGTITDIPGSIWYSLDSLVRSLYHIADEIIDQNISKYTLSYFTPDSSFDGSLREVDITVNYEGLSDSDTGTYYAPESLVVELLEPLTGTSSSDSDQMIEIKLNYDMEMVDVPSISIRVGESLYSISDSELSISADTLIFTPAYEYDDGDSVTIALENVEDILGRAILRHPVEWYFKTDFSPPYLFDHYPGDGDTISEIAPEIIMIVRDDVSGLYPPAFLVSINSVNMDLTSDALSWFEPETLVLNTAYSGMFFEPGDTVTVEVLRMCDNPDYGDHNCSPTVDWSFMIAPTLIPEDKEVPTKFSLGDAFPNPFNSSITISYSLPKHSNVKLAIYDILGNKVRILVDKIQNSGYYNATWNGCDDKGKQCSSGIYFISAKTNEFLEIKACLLLK